MRPGQAVCRPVVVLAIGVSLLLSGCSKTSQEDLDKAKAAGASEEAAKLKQKTLEEEQARLAAEVKRLQAAAAKSASATAPAAATVTQTVQGGTVQGGTGTKGTSCGGNLSVGPNTTCAFAANVRSAFYDAGGGNVNVEVYSPVTGRYYTMYCVAGVPSVCRGGNNAVVYIR
jgi:hypothetical protein